MIVPFAEEFAILMIKFLTNNSAGWSLLISDDSTKPTEVTPDTAVVAVVKPEAEESAVKLSPDEAQAWLEKSEKFVKLVAENLRCGSLTKRFVTIVVRDLYCLVD